MSDLHKPKNMNEILILLGVGLAAGFFSGLVGIGGGVIVVPLLVFFFGYSQHLAQGTTLFMFLMPVGILGVINYHRAGHVDWKVACIMAITFVVGSYFGSKVAIKMDQTTIKKIFGVIIILLGAKMVFWK